jgi:hypothetical protein
LIAHRAQALGRSGITLATAPGGKRPAARDDEVGPWQRFGAGIVLKRRGVVVGGGPVLCAERRLDRGMVEEEVVVAD